MTAEILIKFARKGIILSPEAYNLIVSSENPLNLCSEIIVKLKSGNYPKDMVPVDLETLKSMEGLNINVKTSEPKLEKPPIETKEETPKTFEKPVVEQTTEKPLTETETQKTTEKPLVDNRPMERPVPESETQKTIEKPLIEPKGEVEKPSPIPKEIKETGMTQVSQPEADKSIGKLDETEEKTGGEDKTKIDSDEHIVKIEDTEVSDDVKIKYKRNLTESKVNFDKFKVLKDTSNKSYTSGEIGNLIEYFQNRYKKLSDILSKRPELRTFQKIN